MNNKKKYISPTLNVDTFQVEKGFVISTRMHMFNLQFLDNFDDNSTEKWSWDETNSEQNHFGGSTEYEWD